MKYSVEVMRVREQTIQLNGWAVESNPDSVITYRVEDEAGQPVEAKIVPTRRDDVSQIYYKKIIDRDLGFDIRFPYEHGKNYYLVICGEKKTTRVKYSDMTIRRKTGAKLSVGGCMKELLRTKVGRFELSESLTLDELQKLKEEDRLAEAVLPVEEVFKELPEIRSDTEELDKLLKNGNPFRSRAVKDVKGGDMFRVYHSDGTFIGVFKYDEEKHMYYPEKIFLGGN